MYCVVCILKVCTIHIRFKFFIHQNVNFVICILNGKAKGRTVLVKVDAKYNFNDTLAHLYSKTKTIFCTLAYTFESD